MAGKLELLKVAGNGDPFASEVCFELLSNLDSEGHPEHEEFMRQLEDGIFREKDVLITGFLPTPDFLVKRSNFTRRMKKKVHCLKRCLRRLGPEERGDRACGK